MSILLQAGEPDLFSMVDIAPTGENTEVSLLSCEFLPCAWIEAGRLIALLLKYTGVFLGWIGRIERGLYLPNLKLLFKIAKTLQVKVKDLFPQEL